MVSCSPITLHVLFSFLTLNHEYVTPNNFFRNKNKSLKNYIGTTEKYIEIRESWKHTEWINWMNQLEKEWKDFNSVLVKEKKKCLAIKEQKWNKWINNLEKKWMDYDQDIIKECKSDIFKNSKLWDESDWVIWIETEGKQHMQKDCENWIKQNRYCFNEWIMKQWVEWKNKKIMQWFMNSWKYEEDDYWESWERRGCFEKWLNKAKRKKWALWCQRNDRETEQWNRWVKSKEVFYKNYVISKSMEWENEKRMLFDHWMKYFISKWIDKKQWLVWVKKRHNAINKINVPIKKKKKKKN
ncbi:tryptophan-rich antigen [Plasmodium gonderi]|uniref:Tryptophan-rich antigen n=1 Tax=Plasmodium gonderi TaxID=77519 RepID=A0A1Y1JBH3_PLAGO|nr:tryptophan-rich antigen [Plasmodium gonderi]GAW79600.1 tryptophan-rich antigen [Plasmodium gonderi]